MQQDVSENVLMLAYLSKLVDKIDDLTNEVRSLTEEGELISRTYTVTTNPVPVHLRCAYVTFTNNSGSSTVYILDRDGNVFNEAGLNAKDVININLRTAKNRTFYLVCNSGSATVRVIGW